MVKTRQIKELPSKINRRTHQALMLSVLFLVFIWGGCDRNMVFEENTDLPNFVWEADNVVSYEVEIEDTVQLYNLLLNVRHSSLLYANSNVWLRVGMKNPSLEEVFNERFEIILAENTGKWLGDCMGDICDKQTLFKGQYKFKNKGKYRIQLAQIMRQENLTAVMSVGLRVETAELEAEK